MRIIKADLVIDAKKATLGRLASYTAKQALLGKSVVIVNCDEAVIGGNPNSIILEYRDIRSKGGASLHGPFFPKDPEKLVKRTIRGMLPHRQYRGREAMKRIRCFNGVPEEYKDSKKFAAGKPKKTRVITLMELRKEI